MHSAGILFLDSFLSELEFLEGIFEIEFLEEIFKSFSVSDNSRKQQILFNIKIILIAASS